MKRNIQQSFAIKKCALHIKRVLFLVGAAEKKKRILSVSYLHPTVQMQKLTQKSSWKDGERAVLPEKKNLLFPSKAHMQRAWN